MRSASSSEVLELRVLPAVTILIDYRYDNGFFNTPEKKAAIEAVAAELGSRLNDNLAAIPAGTYEISDPRRIGDDNAPRLDVTWTAAMADLNTFRVFVAGAPLSGDTAAQAGPEINTAARDFDAATDFAPFAGSAGFDNDGSTTFNFNDTATGDETNFRAVARHELLHALGIGTAQSWEAKIVNNVFTGANARAANGGASPPVLADPDGSHGHFAPAVNSIMIPTTSETITHPTAIDWGALADIGWQVGTAGTASGYADVFARTAAGTWMVSRNSGTLSAPAAFGQWAETAGWRDVAQGDFNGDGLTDVVGRTDAGEWYVGLNTGAGFENRLFGRWNPQTLWRDVQVGDFDGDRKTDVAGRTAGGAWYVGRSTGDAFATSLFGTWYEPAQWRDVRVGDFDGDTRADVAGRSSSGEWFVGLSLGNRFSTLRWAVWNEQAQWRDVRVADFDANGKADLAGRASDGSWWVALSSGNVLTTVGFGAWNEAAGWRGVAVGDFAGDARLDVIGRTATGDWYVGVNVGGFSFSTIPFGHWNEADWRSVLVGDFAGSHLRTDILGRAADGSWWLGENSGTGLTFRPYGKWDEALGWRDVAASRRLFVAGPGAAAPPAFKIAARPVTAPRAASAKTEAADASPALAPRAATEEPVVTAGRATGPDDAERDLPPLAAPPAGGSPLLWQDAFGDDGLLEALVAGI